MTNRNKTALRTLKTAIMGGVLAASICTVSAQAPTAEEKPGWDTSAALGLTLTRGNSDTLLFTGNIITGKKWDNHEVSLGADATYGENEVTVDVPNNPPPGTHKEKKTDKSAESLHGFGQYNRLVSDRTYGFVRLDALHDAVARVEYRFTLSPGIGYYFVKKENTRLSGEVGPGLVYEKQGGETSTYLTLRLAERFDHKLSDRAKIWQSLEILPQVDDYENCIINFELGLESSLTEKLSLRTYIQNSYDNQPAEAAINGLHYHRHDEETAVNTFVHSIRAAARLFQKDPLSTPLIPNWNRIQSALPDFFDELNEAVRLDNEM